MHVVPTKLIKKKKKKKKTTKSYVAIGGQKFLYGSE